MSTRDIVIERELAAPRALVWANWTRAEHVQGWFAPDGFDVTDCDFVAEAGRSWRVVYRSATGATIVESGRFEEVNAPARLVFTLTQDDGRPGPETRVVVTFTEAAGKTQMRFHQTGFESDQRRDGNAEGWRECLRTLAHNVEGEAELRQLFADWTRASSAKDLDAAMHPIAADVVSYEHQAPLVHHGVAAVREVCAAGFAAAPADFTWTVPDLEVIVRDDLAVTWGINRMQFGDVVRHSRGTRVFRRIAGRWQLIHQHLSIPA